MRHRFYSAARREKRAALDAVAADWLVAHDRGLSAQQQREFDRWLAADPRHPEAWTEAQHAWARLDRLPELTPLATVSRGAASRRTWATVVMAAAALTLGFFFLWPQWQTPRPDAVAELVRVTPQQLALPDGTLVELNAGSEVAEQFTAAERRVRLVRGEAHFVVVKNPARPFVVEAGGVAVRAVGTAFNVRLDRTALEVLVTEGRVQVETSAAASVASQGHSPASLDSIAAAPAMVEAGQRAIVGLTPAARPPEISALSPAEIARALAWQRSRLHFQDMSLEQVAAEFNRHNRTRLVVDASAAGTLVAGSFRAENVEVFVHFLEQGFGISAERRGDTTIVLRKAR